MLNEKLVPMNAESGSWKEKKIYRRTAALFLAIALWMTAYIPVWADEAIVLSSVEDVKQYVITCAQNGDAEISFSYTEELDELFADADGMRAILYNCGFLEWDQYRMSNRRVKIDQIVYRHGFKIVQAWRTGFFDKLDQTEWETYCIAQDIATDAIVQCNGFLERERYIHDAICAMATYEEIKDQDGWTYNDTAVGALYYGRAECDGYADAFYLIGNLAALNVVYQYGATLDSETGEYSGHMWNMIYLDGGCYHVDVTWDDLDFADDNRICRYAYFNAGDDLMDERTWDSELSFGRVSPHTNWNVYFYSCGQAGQEGFGAYYETLEDAAWYVVNQQRQGAYSAHVMVKGGNHKDGVAFNEYITNAGISGRYTTWTQNMGGYTCFDVLFFD